LLFVFDNFDQPGEFATVKDFFPHGAKILFTSRHVDSKRLGNPIEVGAMSAEEGVELLLHQAGLEKTAENVENAKAITQELGGLALAIDQAATYLSARHVPLHSFSNVYEKRRAAILKHVSRVSLRLTSFHPISLDLSHPISRHIFRFRGFGRIFPALRGFGVSQGWTLGAVTLIMSASFGMFPLVLTHAKKTELQ